jgi:hypothetical protein
MRGWVHDHRELDAAAPSTAVKIRSCFRIDGRWEETSRKSLIVS